MNPERVNKIGVLGHKTNLETDVSKSLNISKNESLRKKKNDFKKATNTKKDDATFGHEYYSAQASKVLYFEEEVVSNSSESFYVSSKKNSTNQVNENSVEHFSLDQNLSSSMRSPFKRSLPRTPPRFLSTKNSNYTNLSFEEANLIKRQNNLKEVCKCEESKYEQMLKHFCLEKGLEMPVYSLTVKESINQSKSYGCKLNIGDKFQASTYPVETHTETTARELASKKAFSELSELYETENVIKLRELCLKKNLPKPFFKTIECLPKNQPKYFISKVKIGVDILLSSYPAEAPDEVSAKDLAAKKAYEYLTSQTDKCRVKIVKDEVTILSQIYNVVQSKQYGVWCNKLPSLYLDMYSEELPESWLDMAKQSPKFEINSIEKAGHIIRVKNSSELAVDSEPPKLATLKFPGSNQWEVYITDVVTSAEVWCRLIGKEYSVSIS